jgi:hypothetical protein
MFRIKIRVSVIVSKQTADRDDFGRNARKNAVEMLNNVKQKYVEKYFMR